MSLSLVDDESRPVAAPVIRIRGLTKSFNGRVVLRSVDLDLHAGEFIALLGPNGAGKSTLIKILDGIYKADAGMVEASGGRETVRTGIVHQDLGLVDELSVFDNLRLGASPLRRRSGFLDRRKEVAAARHALERFGLNYSIWTPVGRLSPGERALLAVARVAAQEPNLIVLDEVTSALSASDAKELIATLKARSHHDVSFVMVTHKLTEALDLATRVVVLRDGSVVCDRGVPLPNMDEVTKLLLDQLPLDQDVGAEPVTSTVTPEPMLAFRSASAGDVGPLDFSVARGEAVAITGRAGSSLPTVAYMAIGARRIDRGSLWIREGARCAIVPPNRETEGNLSTLSVRWNLTISSLGRWRRSARTLHLAGERRAAEEMISSLSVVPADGNAVQGVLSGGNQQKVIFGRALMTRAQIYILCEPTRGVDIATRRQIYRLMRQLKEQGCALLILSADPEDVLAVADRVLILQDGRIEADYQAAHVTMNELANVV